MTIDEAIDSLEHILASHGGLYSRKGEAALQLGIEALKYVKTSRDPSGVPPYSLLPGETEE